MAIVFISRLGGCWMLRGNPSHWIRRESDRYGDGGRGRPSYSSTWGHRSCWSLCGGRYHPMAVLALKLLRLLQGAEF